VQDAEEGALEAGAGATVPELVLQRWGARLEEAALARFAEPGWTYQEQIPHRPCPACAGTLHSLRKPYESAGRTYRYVAVVCPSCPRAYTLADLGVKTYDKLLAHPRLPAPTPPAAPALPAPTLPLGPCPDGPGATVTATSAPAPAARWEPADPRWPRDLAMPTSREQRRLLWCKVTDPAWRPAPAALAAAEDVRVILPEGDAFAPLRQHLAEHGAQVRSAAYWIESEQVCTVNEHGSPTDLVARPLTTDTPPAAPLSGPAAYAARDAFAAQWDCLEDLPAAEAAGYVPVTDLVPADWQHLLPHPAFNPAQAAAVPAVLDTDDHLVVVAPTGAGKTPIGMVAALKTHAGGRKAAWLVPQRSLTDELDRELDTWRRNGLHVVRLTGEYAVDADLIATSDIWVATTEKFEAICRTASLRTALAEVGCLVVDEIHLLGDPTRGPILEALLTRVRQDATQVRIVGLSATVANADQITDWLGAHLIRTTWRPTRLTWQLPLLPEAADDPDWATRTAARTRAAVELARQATTGGGSALIFCGSKRAVRATALAVAADRGIPTTGADTDDVELVERLCTKAGVRLHYRDWPHKRDAEHAFRTRQADILVATSTVAAGVNLPARTVIVRDTQVGIDRIEVSMVQQMFGRAGRIGAGETEGFAHLLTTPTERPHWQARLAAGYTVTSRIRDRLPDHLLAEAVQDRITTLTQAEHWWTHTLAHHQGHHSPDPLHDATDFLTDAGYLHRHPRPDGNDQLQITEPGKLTSRFMVDAELAATLTDDLTQTPVPDDPDTAEDLLITLLATRLPTLEQAPFTDRARTAFMRVLHTGGRIDPHETPEDNQDEEEKYNPAPRDLARAVLLLVANSPQAFRTRAGYILGIPVDSMTGILDEARRYLAWLGAQGHLETVHPWAAIVAADLAARIRWRALAPRRGSGRLLWMCEQMATPPHAARLVPDMWRAARARGITDPDWPGPTPPSLCPLPPPAYTDLLAARTTGTHTTPTPGGWTIRASRGTTVRLWNGANTTGHTADGTPTTLPCPAPDPADPAAGSCAAAVFTRRGDRIGVGWPAAYNTITTSTRASDGPTA
jgi:helicase